MLESFTPAEYAAGAAKGYKVIDIQPAASIPGAEWINLTKVTGLVEGLGCLLDKRYDDIESLINFLNEYGLLTGGTGSLASPESALLIP